MLTIGFGKRVHIPYSGIGGRCMSTSVWCPLENAFVCLRAHARKYSGAAKTHTAEQHGSPLRGSRVAVAATTRARL